MIDAGGAPTVCFTWGDEPTVRALLACAAAGEPSAARVRAASLGALTLTPTLTPALTLSLTLSLTLTFTLALTLALTLTLTLTLTLALTLTRTLTRRAVRPAARRGGAARAGRWRRGAGRAARCG